MTTSFKKKLPVPTPVLGFAIVITGGLAYPNPALVSRISVIVPAALTIATPVAFAEVSFRPRNIFTGKVRGIIYDQLVNPNAMAVGAKMENQSLQSREENEEMSTSMRK